MNEGIEQSLRESAGHQQAHDQATKGEPSAKGAVGSNSAAKKKAKRVEFNNDEAIANVVSELGGLKHVIDKAVEALGSILGDEDNDSSKQATLMALIGKIDGLTRCQVIDAAIALVDNESKTKLFYALKNEEDRFYFVKSLLS
ncbi:unnamed protein product [Linum trigynum]